MMREAGVISELKNQSAGAGKRRASRFYSIIGFVCRGKNARQKKYHSCGLCDSSLEDFSRSAGSSSVLGAAGTSTRRFFHDSRRACACKPIVNFNKHVARPPTSTSSPEANFFG